MKYFARIPNKIKDCDGDVLALSAWAEDEKTVHFLATADFRN
jgi:hypothetical protein